MVVRGHSREGKPWAMPEERRRRSEEQVCKHVLGKQQEKAWGWGKAGCDSTAAMKGLGLLGEPQLS